ncbi:MAG TPA: transcription antitermination factor NusB [Candidatus Acidoferrales bacterium]|nr:transcription antitermination factor NusB [Candidatus Acidoferrales bacterium]
MTGPATGTRRRAREVAFRVAYQADVAGDDYAFAWKLRREEESLTDDQAGLIDDVVGALASRGPEIDAALSAAADHWPLARLAATDRAVMRVALAELLARPGSPARVVLDEAIEIARRFGSSESGRFVNGVLDRAAHELRPAEF